MVLVVVVIEKIKMAIRFRVVCLNERSMVAYSVCSNRQTGVVQQWSKFASTMDAFMNPHRLPKLGSLTKMNIQNFEKFHKISTMKQGACRQQIVDSVKLHGVLVPHTFCKSLSGLRPYSAKHNKFFRTHSAPQECGKLDMNVNENSFRNGLL